MLSIENLKYKAIFDMIGIDSLETKILDPPQVALKFLFVIYPLFFIYSVIGI
jgi:hypothetical protein